MRGIRVLICGAGMAAALPGVVAAYTELPVIGVPIASGGLGGMDALLAISQMPPGVPVGCMAIGGARNAAIFASRILAQGGTPDRRRANERASGRRRRRRARSRWRASEPPPSAATRATCRPPSCSSDEERARYRTPLPRSGVGLEAAIERVANEVLPRSLSHSHARSFPFIDGSGLEAGVAAAVLAAALDANLGGGAAAASEVEDVGLALAGRADRLPGRRSATSRAAARTPT